MNLNAYMKKHSLTNEQVAEAIQVTQATVSRIRRWPDHPKSNQPSWQTVDRLEVFSRGAITANDFRRPRP